MRRLPVVRLLSVGALLSGFLGCESRPDVRSYPGLSSEESASLPKLVPRAAEPAPAEEQPANEVDPFAPAPAAPGAVPDPGSLMAPRKPDAVPGAAPAGGATTGGTPEEEKRDLGEELKAALGQPVDCLDLSQLPPSGGTISVRIGAYVGPSGRITRANVSASGQPSSTLSCIEKRAVAIKMREPIDNAPLLVSTTLEFEIARAPTAAAPAPTPPPPAPSY